MNIVLIEDDAWLAEMEVAVLEAAGHAVQVAPHALEAMQRIDERLPDLIITDVLLSGTTAFTLLHELQSHDDTKNIPVILCSNVADQLTARHLEAYGVMRVVDKSTMHPQDIAAAVALLEGGGHENLSH